MDPTKIKEGYTEESYCSRCHEIFKGKEFIPAPSYNFVDGVCTHCGAKRKNTQWLEFELSSDGRYYAVRRLGDVTDTEIYISEEYDGTTAKKIGSRAFSMEKVISLADIPSSLVKIVDKAFYFCSSLTHVQLLEGLEEIGE